MAYSTLSLLGIGKLWPKSGQYKYVWNNNMQQETGRPNLFIRDIYYLAFTEKVSCSPS